MTTDSFYGVDLSAPCGREADGAELREVFESVKPKLGAVPLIRIGEDRDGSYLLPDDLDGIAACFSPGVNRIKFFEDFLADRYAIPSHMVDFSTDVERFATPLKPGLQTFARKWLDVTPGEDNISLEDWVRERHVDGDWLLQMDIEGAEYRNILATSDETLARFRVIVLEVHGLRRMLEAPVLHEVIAPFFAKLTRNHTCVHAHPNNCCGEFALPGTDITIPNVLEITLLRTDHFQPAPGPVPLPHPLDVSRNVPSKPPLNLSLAWCGDQRPVESRVKIIEDQLRYRNEVGAAAAESELGSVLALTMQSVQTMSRLARPAAPSDATLREIARHRPYRLSSTYGGSSETGVVQPAGDYFFHTGFGTDQWIRLDLGSRQRVRRIEVSNRLGSHQERARYIFAMLTDDIATNGTPRVFPLFQPGRLRGGAWQECGIDLPDLPGRYLTITSPVNTALHFSDLKVFVADPEAVVAPRRPWTPQRVARGVRRRLRRVLGAMRSRTSTVNDASRR